MVGTLPHRVPRARRGAGAGARAELRRRARARWLGPRRGGPRGRGRPFLTARGRRRRGALEGRAGPLDGDGRSRDPGRIPTRAALDDDLVRELAAGGGREARGRRPLEARHAGLALGLIERHPCSAGLRMASRGRRGRSFYGYDRWEGLQADARAAARSRRGSRRARGPLRLGTRSRPIDVGAARCRVDARGRRDAGGRRRWSAPSPLGPLRDDRRSTGVSDAARLASAAPAAAGARGEGRRRLPPAGLAPRRARRPLPRASI